MSAQFVIQDENTWRLGGELSFTTVGTLLTDFSKHANLPPVLDLQDITRTDSAGLAFLIELRKRSQSNPIVFRNIPKQMLTLAAVSGVERLLT
jgi:phospholipid transport system transporter-binding protein